MEESNPSLISDLKVELFQFHKNFLREHSRKPLILFGDFWGQAQIVHRWLKVMNVNYFGSAWQSTSSPEFQPHHHGHPTGREVHHGPAQGLQLDGPAEDQQAVQVFEWWIGDPDSWDNDNGQAILTVRRHSQVRYKKLLMGQSQFVGGVPSSQMIACCVFHNSKSSINEEATSFIRDLCCHLTSEWA